jgi:hypothetical protein
VGRGVLVVVAVAALGGCGRNAAPAAAVDGALAAVPIDTMPPDAARVEPDAEPIDPKDVLSGSAAEQAIAAGKTVDTPGEKPPEPTPIAPPVGPTLLITTDGVGPFRLGAPRADVVRHLAGRAILQRMATPVGEPTVEVATLPGVTGLPLLRLRIYAGRLQEIHVVARDRRAVTDGDIGVGTTFGDAMNVYGDARAVREPRSGRRLGFVLADLPGVVLVPADAASLVAVTPAATARIARLLVLGPEATADED